MYNLEDNTTSINIDDYYVSFESGLPKGSYKMNDILGDGGMIDGMGSIGGRIVKISRTFLRENEVDRDLWMSWFTRPIYDEIYLRRTSTNFIGIARVFPQLAGGESFNVRNFNFSKDIPFEMLMENPYFESTTITNSSAISLTSTAQISNNITIAGMKVFANYSLTIGSTTCQTFQIKTAEGYGFNISYNFQQNDVVNVSTSDSQLIVTINGIILDSGNFTSGSQPFELKSGINTLYIIGSSNSTLVVSYYERHL